MTGHAIDIAGRSLDIATLTCEDLRVHYQTLHNVHISGTRRNRVTEDRTGMKTNIGDIEISAWMDLIRGLITRLGETDLQEQLQRWVKENCAWLHTQEAVEQYALELHATRIFDDPMWIGYIGFNRQYRPEALMNADLIWGKRKCCGKSRQMTREHFEWMRSIIGGEEYCCDCGGHTSLVLTDPPEEGND